GLLGLRLLGPLLVLFDLFGLRLLSPLPLLDSIRLAQILLHLPRRCLLTRARCRGLLLDPLFARDRLRLLLHCEIRRILALEILLAGQATSRRPAIERHA